MNDQNLSESFDVEHTWQNGLVNDTDLHPLALKRIENQAGLSYARTQKQDFYERLKSLTGIDFTENNIQALEQALTTQSKPMVSTRVFNLLYGINTNIELEIDVAADVLLAITEDELTNLKNENTKILQLLKYISEHIISS